MKLTSYLGNPWIGLFIANNEESALVPLDAPKKIIDSVQEYLKVQVFQTSVADSNLIGAYTVMNSYGVVAPNMTTNNEIEAIKRMTGLNVYRSAEKHNAHGNNIVVNDKGGIASIRIKRTEIELMADALGVELVQEMVGGYTTVGSVCRSTNNGFLVHYSANDEDIGRIKDILKVNGNKGTVNLGAGFVSLGILANSYGYVAGDKTSPYELGRVEEALGFLNR